MGSSAKNREPGSGLLIKNRSLFLAAVSASLFLLASCSSMLIQDVKPPPGFIPTWQIPPVDNSTVNIAPLLPPDPAEGNVVYEANCASCHGFTGMGDGQKAGNLPSLPPPIGSLQYSRYFSPSTWFHVVTIGRIDRLMPGFAKSLSDRQRWDVTAYLMSMEESYVQLDDGRTAYTETCQRCHGKDANSGPAPDLTNPLMLKRSLDDVIDIISEGYGSMPAVGQGLSGERQLNTALYLRSLQFAEPGLDSPRADELPQTSTPEDVSALDGDLSKNMISGRVINGSGVDLPAGLPVDLLVYDAENLKFTDRRAILKDGSFVFENIPGGSGEVYLLTTTYADIVYSSDALHSNQINDFTNQIITVYETDTDISLIKAERMHIFFEFPSTETIRVIQMYILSNPTNKLITSPAAGEPVIRYQLPTGASNLQFQGGSLGERFVKTPDGFGDIQGIPPGTGTQVLFSFDLGYKSDLPFYLKLPVTVETINAMLPAGNVSIKSSRLQILGEKDIQGTSWNVYISDRMESGTPLDLLVSGKPVISDMIMDDWDTNLAVGVISLAVVLMIVAMLIHQNVASRKKMAYVENVARMSDSDREAILDAIIALDDQYHAGQIPHNAYIERRNELKTRIGGDTCEQ